MKKIIIEHKASGARRKNKLVSRVLLCATIIFTAALCGIGVSKIISLARLQNSQSSERLYSLWESGDYQGVYDLAGKITAVNPFQNTACAFLGYSAYYLALSQTEQAAAQNYLEQSINKMRIALLQAKNKTAPQIYYMLGKAYFLKNSLNSYVYYADLSTRYLLLARKGGYGADDIAEYLGLSYAALGMTDKSIEAFTEALMVRESDVLLYSIGEQYLKNGSLSVAKQYFFRVISTSADDSLTLKSRNLLAQLYTEEENYAEAEKEFKTILEKDVNFADAYYGLGVLYEKQGDTAKARSQWRNALKAQPGHAGAKQKLGA